MFLMVEEDLGEAVIVYEGPDGETIEQTVDNEHIAYFQDHWLVKTGESEAGQDTVRRIPAQRVFYVERDVEAFEREIATTFDDLQSVADEFDRGISSFRDAFDTVTEDIQSVLLGEATREREESEVIHIDIENGESDDVSDAPDKDGASGDDADEDES